MTRDTVRLSATHEPVQSLSLIHILPRPVERLLTPVEVEVDRLVTLLLVVLRPVLRDDTPVLTLLRPVDKLLTPVLSDETPVLTLLRPVERLLTPVEVEVDRLVTLLLVVLILCLLSTSRCV